MNYYKTLGISANAEDRDIAMAAKEIKSRLPYETFVTLINMREYWAVRFSASMAVEMCAERAHNEYNKYADLSDENRLLMIGFRCYSGELKYESSDGKVVYIGVGGGEEKPDFDRRFQTLVQEKTGKIDEVKNTLLDPNTRSNYNQQVSTEFAKMMYEDGLVDLDKIQSYALDDSISNLPIPTLLPLIEQNIGRNPEHAGSLYFLARLYARCEQTEKAISTLDKLLGRGNYIKQVIEQTDFNTVRKELDDLPSYIQAKRETEAAEHQRKAEAERIREIEERKRKDRETSEQLLEIFRSKLEAIETLSNYVETEFEKLEDHFTIAKGLLDTEKFSELLSLLETCNNDADLLHALAKQAEDRSRNGLCIICGGKINMVSKVLGKKTCNGCR